MEFFRAERMKSYLKSAVPWGIGLSLVLVIGAAALSYRNLVEQTEDFEWVTHTHVVIERLETLRSEILKVENARRGYVLTGDAEFLRRLSAGRDEIHRTLGALRTLIADNPGQEKHLEELQPLIQARLELLDRSLTIHRAARPDDAEQAALTLPGAELTTRILAALDAMDGAERDLLQKRIEQAQQSRRRSRILLPLGTAITIALILAVFTLLRREVAERARAEEDLNRFFNVSADMMCVAGTDGYFKRVNPAFERTLGYSVAELMARPYLEFVHPDDLAATQAAAQTASATGLMSFENRYRTKQGDFRWLNWNSSPDQQRSLIYAAARDVTETRAAHEQLQASEARFRQLVESAADAIVGVDEQGAIVLVNARAERLFGYGREELLGQPEEILMPERFRAAHARHRSEYLAHPVTRPMGAEGERYGMHKSGAEFPVDLSLSHLHTDQGQILMSIVCDMTERKRAQEELKLRTIELEAANKELEAFTSSVAHDLRAPLRHVDGFSRILIEEHAGQLDAEGRRLLDRVRHATQHMGELVDDLLNLSRVSRRELSPLVTDLNPLVRDVISGLQTSCQDRRVEFRVGTLPFAECDPGLMRQVFANLLANAVKFTRPRDPAIIEVGQSEHNGSRAIFVRDNGVGFSMKYADKLFGVFQRLHRSEDFEGTGVGLVTVQRIVQKHNGRIWAEAEVDRGAAFYFTLEGLDNRRAAETPRPAGGVHARR